MTLLSLPASLLVRMTLPSIPASLVRMTLLSIPASLVRMTLLSIPATLLVRIDSASLLAQATVVKQF
jgi:hypothetical protein